MVSSIKQPWIEAGYQLFADQGPAGLKVEVLAKQVGKSKSSFYHHFADIELFTEQLLNYHLVQAKRLAAKEEHCASIDPEMIELFVQHKKDLLFNRQLRVNRNIPLFKACFEKTNELIQGTILTVWTKEMGLKQHPTQAEHLLELALENFYLQITEEHLNVAWLSNYFQKLREMAKSFSRQ